MKMTLSLFLALLFTTLGFGENIEQTKQQYLDAILEPEKYSLKIKQIYNKPETQQKIVDLITNQQLNLDAIQIQFAQSLLDTEHTLMMSPFVNAPETSPSKTPKDPQYKQHFKPDLTKIQQVLKEYDAILMEIQKRQETLNLIDLTLYSSLLGLVESSKNWLILQKQMNW